MGFGYWDFILNLKSLKSNNYQSNLKTSFNISNHNNWIYSVKPKPSKLQTIGPTVNWARNGSKFSYQTDWSFWTMDQSIYYLQEKYILWGSTDRSINPRLDPLDLKHLYISNCLVTHYFHLWFVVGGQIYNRISKKIHEPSILSFSLIRQLVFLIFLRLPIFIMWG